MMNFTVNSTNVTNTAPTTVIPNIPPNPHYRSQATIIAQVTCLAILGVVILLSNLASIVTFMKNQSLRKRSNYLIINLSISDFLVGIVTLFSCPFFFGAPWTGNKISGNALEVIDAWTSTASLVCLTCIGMERFYAVAFPFRHRILRFKHYMVVCLFPWCVATAFVVLVIALDFPRGGKKLKIYELFRFTVLILALVCMAISYLGLWLKSRKANPGAQNQNRALRDQKLSVTLFVVTLASLLMWLPIHGFAYAIYFFKMKTRPHISYFFVMKFLQYSNSGINFFIYIFRIREFREGFLSLFHCRQERNRSESTSSFNLSNRSLSIGNITFSSNLSLSFSRQRSYTVNNDTNDVQTEQSLGTRQQSVTEQMNGHQHV